MVLFVRHKRQIIKNNIYSIKIKMYNIFMEEILKLWNIVKTQISMGCDCRCGVSNHKDPHSLKINP